MIVCSILVAEWHIYQHLAGPLPYSERRIQKSSCPESRKEKVVMGATRWGVLDVLEIGTPGTKGDRWGSETQKFPNGNSTINYYLRCATTMQSMISSLLSELNGFSRTDGAMT